METLIHGDLALDNVLVDAHGALSLIDWADGGSGDPRHDVALALQTKPEFELSTDALDAFCTGYGAAVRSIRTRATGSCVSTTTSDGAARGVTSLSTARRPRACRRTSASSCSSSAGSPLVIVGNRAAGAFVNGWWFRLAHLAAIAVVVAQAWLGVVCPLTTLESWLRVQVGQAAYEASFIEHWLARILFYDAPAWVFTAAYTLFGVAVAAAWWRFPPRKRG